LDLSLLSFCAGFCVADRAVCAIFERKQTCETDFVIAGDFGFEDGGATLE
jgi:hypothetical protein